MASYAYTLTTFNGTTLSTFAASAYFLFDNGPAQMGIRQTVEANVPGLGTRDVRGQPVAQTWEAHINLKDTTEATYAAFLACFNEESGQAALVATDGSVGSWTVQARVIAIRGVNSVQYVAALRVADPRWMQTGGTSSQLAKQTTFGPFTLANTGNRQARPAVTITAGAAKTGVADDFGRQLQGFIVNRAPYDWTNKPVCLFDVEGAASRINTAGLCTAAGDDIRVWLDDVPDCPRWLVTPNAAGTEVWINVTMPAAIPLTLVAAMTNASPAAGQSFVVNEDISRLPQKGFVAVIKEGANASEVIYFNSRAGRTLLGIQRAQWGTTAGAHALGASCYPNPKHYVVGTSFSNILTSAYGPPPAPLAQRPCIQLPDSSNQTWKWGDESNDASTIYFDRNYPDRTAQWVPGFDLDGNAVSPLMSLNSAKAAGTGGVVAAEFIDNVPGDGNPPYNYVEQFFPQGVKPSDTAAITIDWTSSPEVLNSELFIRDAGGNLKLADQQQNGLASTRTLASAGAIGALGSTAYGVKLKARYDISTGYYTHQNRSLLIKSTSGGPNTDGAAAQKFRITKELHIKSIAIVAALASGVANVSLILEIVHDINGFPDTAGTPVRAYSDQLPVFVLSTVMAVYRVSPTGLILQPGTYHLAAWHFGGAAVDVVWASFGGGGYPYGYASARAAGIWGYSPTFTENASAAFYIEGAYDNSLNSVIESEQPVVDYSGAALARTGSVASFDKPAFIFNTSQSPYVHRTGTFAQTLLHLAGTLSSSTTGKAIAFDKWMTPAAATLAIDCDARTVIYTEVGVAIPMAKACTFSDTADWFPLNAGNNALTYTEASLAAPGQLGLVATWNQTKV